MPISRIVVVTLLFAFAVPTLAQAQDIDLRRKLNVAGAATTLVANDAARVSLTVQSERKTAGGALSAASRKLRSVIGRVRATGVLPADIRTRQIGVRKLVKRLESGERKTLGYRATQGISVIVHNVPTVGVLVDRAVAAGATGVSGPTFFVSNTPRLYRDALALAFDDAKAKAQLLAERSGAKLGPVLSISEGVEFAEESAAFDQAPAAPGAPAPATVPPPTQPGQSQIEATVKVVFELLPVQ